MFILNRGRHTLLEQLKSAIKQDQDGATFIYELIKAWREVPVLILSNIGDKFIESLKANQDVIQLLAQDKGRKWLKDNLDNIINYLLHLSRS